MSVVDWPLATRTARRLTRQGPQVSHAEAAEAVAEMREAAVRAHDHVSQVTGLVATATPELLVVDRPTWCSATVESFAELLAPLDQRTETSALSAKVTGLEVGALLPYLSTRVLGQYDPYVGDGPGRLLLVAPSIVAVERALAVDPSDFRLWVTLHEQTHVLQFLHGPTPWLRDHLRGRITALLSEMDLTAGALSGVAANVASKLRGRRSELSLSDLVPDERAGRLVEEITAVMSLLEGHADVIMDEVGPEVVGTVRTIRARFTQRRAAGGIDGLVRNLLGLDAKMRQYRDGAAFCRALLAEVGMDGLNTVFTSPDTLPSAAEIADPQAWLARVAP
ncbi:MAG TPA: zinc-dependent metalloprotease [Candidatus Avipropionibacterium avicola]|uniref:Zinc-dependent metalloprotease n=1 Tax=Candidatus Avipropionibacterium avicola TaxID=2840701 RepID=A0A9D1KNW1_9ACTN|nr:zinc-dependent metalloprotease [Candidatus Avipropionibacterium avicola]